MAWNSLEDIAPTNEALDTLHEARPHPFPVPMMPCVERYLKEVMLSVQSGHADDGPSNAMTGRIKKLLGTPPLDGGAS